jgi:hypothetical protein
MRKQRGGEVFRITGARQSLDEDVRGRQRRYVISMLIRTAAVLLTVFLWNVERPLAIVTLVVGLVLPYVAVVIANAGRENAPSQPASYVPPAVRPMLRSGTGDEEEHVAEGRVAEGRVAGEHVAEGRVAEGRGTDSGTETEEPSTDRS